MNIKQQFTTVTRFSKIVILVLFVLLLIVGFYFRTPFQASIPTDAVPVIHEKLNDRLLKKTDCDGKSNPYYSSGFGVEHIYEGTIKPEKNVKVILSCDHRRFTISGAVNQVILSSDIKDMDYLADLTSGELVVDLNSDYNFDGYNDLSSIVNNGQGREAIISYAIFLFEPQKRQFVYNSELSSLKNISVAKEKKLLIQTFCHVIVGGDTVCEEIMYKWSNGNLIKF